MQGTRVPADVILDNLAAGETPATIRGEYPTLRAEPVPAAIAFAGELARERLESQGWDVHGVHEEELAAALDRAILHCLDGAIRALATEPIRATLWIVEPEHLRVRDHPTGI